MTHLLQAWPEGTIFSFRSGGGALPFSPTRTWRMGVGKTEGASLGQKGGGDGDMSPGFPALSNNCMGSLREGGTDL